MAINITPTTIQIGNFKFRETDTGIEFTGQANTAGFVGASRAGVLNGYFSAGTQAPTPPSAITTIEKFPFASDNNAVDTGGDLTEVHYYGSGHSSATDGYSAGGEAPPFAVNSNVIDKFPFSVDTNASDVGDLTAAKSQQHGTGSITHGYASNGASGGAINVIEKFPYAVDTNATDVGDTTASANRVCGGFGPHTTTTGYRIGGIDTSPGRVTTIDSFPFSVDTNATDVGDITAGRIDMSGHSSNVDGYVSAGSEDPGIVNKIEKFPFASHGTATDVGDLTQGRSSTRSGTSSQTSGYIAGGSTGPTTNVDTIDKFPFSVDTNSTDVGNLTQARRSGLGHES
jgi:hypothetical protein